MSFYEVTTPTDPFLLTGSEPVPISFLLRSNPPFLPSYAGFGLVSHRSHPAPCAVLFQAKIRVLQYPQALSWLSLASPFVRCANKSLIAFEVHLLSTSCTLHVVYTSPQPLS